MADLLPHYQRAINRIDDYFEYKRESGKDADFVHKVLADLTKELTNEAGITVNRPEDRSPTTARPAWWIAVQKRSFVSE